MANNTKKVNCVCFLCGHRSKKTWNTDKQKWSKKI